MKAVRHIVAERIGYSPPFIMYGPFGTGKTETLAQAAMVLVKESSSARILICAQSNRLGLIYLEKCTDVFICSSITSSVSHSSQCSLPYV